MQRGATSMESNTKQYYTPEVDEFREGFEFEVFVNGNWQKEIFSLEKWQSYLLDFFREKGVLKENKNLLRAKCLDQQDLESLGFKFIKVFVKSDPIKFSSTDLTIWANFKTQTIEIMKHSGLDLYNGKIRNKFHLRQILKDIC
jgi:hypothetical protein